MTAKRPPQTATPEPVALRRAAKAALAKAQQTGTPAYAVVNGRIVDLAKAKPKARGALT